MYLFDKFIFVLRQIFAERSEFHVEWCNRFLYEELTTKKSEKKANHEIET